MLWLDAMAVALAVTAISFYEYVRCVIRSQLPLMFGCSCVLMCAAVGWNALAKAFQYSLLDIVKILPHYKARGHDEAAPRLLASRLGIVAGMGFTLQWLAKWSYT